MLIISTVGLHSNELKLQIFLLNNETQLGKYCCSIFFDKLLLLLLIEIVNKYPLNGLSFHFLSWKMEMFGVICSNFLISSCQDPIK